MSVGLGWERVGPPLGALTNGAKQRLFGGPNSDPFRCLEVAQPVRETNTGYVTSNVWQELKVGNKRLRPGLPMLIRARRREFPRDDADGGRI